MPNPLLLVVATLTLGLLAACGDAGPADSASRSDRTSAASTNASDLLTWPRRAIGEELEALEASALQLEPGAGVARTAKFLLTARLKEGHLTTFVIPADNAEEGDEVVTLVRTSDAGPWVGVDRTALRDVQRPQALSFLITWPDAHRTLVVLAAPDAAVVRVVQRGGDVSNTLPLNRGLGVYRYEEEEPTGVLADDNSTPEDAAPITGSVVLREGAEGVPVASTPPSPPSS